MDITKVKAGARFTLVRTPTMKKGEQGEHILAYVDDHRMALICLSTGNRWNNAVVCDNPITEEQWGEVSKIPKELTGYVWEDSEWKQ